MGIERLVDSFILAKILEKRELMNQQKGEHMPKGTDTQCRGMSEKAKELMAREDNSVTYEKSCGAIVWRKYQDFGKEKTEYLIIKHRGGHHSFPKGHVEACDQGDIDTARREILEETGLTVDIDTTFRMINTYSPKRGIVKDVIYFSGELNPIDQEVVIQEEELSTSQWLTLDLAMDQVSYFSDKKILFCLAHYIDDTSYKEDEKLIQFAKKPEVAKLLPLYDGTCHRG